jgi:branched-chain amino acid aminotransferase
VTPVSEIGPYKFTPGHISELLMTAYAEDVRAPVSSIALKKVA